MAKLMVMVNFPEIDYDKMREAMLKKESMNEGINFCLPLSKDGLDQVSVWMNDLEYKRRDRVVFELIGVRP